MYVQKPKKTQNSSKPFEQKLNAAAPAFRVKEEILSEEHFQIEQVVTDESTESNSQHQDSPQGEKDSSVSKHGNSKTSPYFETSEKRVQCSQPSFKLLDEGLTLTNL